MAGKNIHKDNWKKRNPDKVKEYRRKYHLANVKGKPNKYASEIRNYLRLLKDVPCLDCKKSYPHYVMDFDHLRDKKFNLCKALASRRTLRIVKEETLKCEIVCSNCHRIRTYKRKELSLKQDNPIL